METRIKISEEITVGAQPTEEELRQLAEDGYEAVVNLRGAGENDQPISPEAEGVQARELGMRYLHIPISMDTMEPQTVDRFRQEIARLPSPVFVHCHKGMRAGALVMMHTAIESGVSGEQTLDKAAELGFQCDIPQLKQFVKSYIDRNKKGSSGFLVGGQRVAGSSILPTRRRPQSHRSPKGGQEIPKYPTRQSGRGQLVKGIRH